MAGSPKHIGSRNVDSTRNYNRASVMQLVLETPGIDRTRLAEATGLTNAAMTRIVQELVSAKLLMDTGTLDDHAGRGRRRTGLKVNGSGGYVLGLSVLAFNTSVALTDISGQTIDSLTVEPVDLSNPKRTLDDIVGAARTLVRRHEIELGRVFGMGAAIAGYLDRSGDIWEQSPYLGWPAFNIRQSLSNRLSLPIAIENVNCCIAIAESRIGSCAGMSNLMLIRAALGLGSANIADGEIVRGHTNRAGQIGHIPVDSNGIVCSCGKRGCLATLTSGLAIIDRLGLKSSEESELGTAESLSNTLRAVLDRAGDGDPGSIGAVKDAASALGRHSAALIQVTDPEAVVLTGPLGRHRIYGEAFREALGIAGVTAKIVTAYEHDIAQPAIAASAMALATQVYSPTFDIQNLFAKTPTEPDSDDRRKLVV